MAPSRESSSLSSLSPPPEDIRSQTSHDSPAQEAEAEVELVAKTAGNRRGQKRKVETTLKNSKRVKKAIKYEEDAESEAKEPPKHKGLSTKKARVEEASVDEVMAEAEEGNDGGAKVKKVQRKRTTSKKQTNLAALEQRTLDTKLRVGAHSQRKWDNPPMDPEHGALFIDGCKKHGIDPADSCLPHGSYLVNLAHPEESRKKQAYDSFHDDLTRCHKLGIRLYNFHPGNCNATTREDGIRLIAEHINTAHKDPATGSVVAVLETMASLGNTIGGTFKDLAEVINLVNNKKRVGVCLDTCHIFAAGYDLRTPDAYAETMSTFDEVIGLKYLKALHMNDSKSPFTSYRDLHAQIGTGYLGLRAFHNIVNDERLHGLPMVLETPIDSKDGKGKKIEDKSIWAREIKLLEKLVGMDVESEEFQKLEAELQDRGKSERERVGDQVERKKAKAKGMKEKGKGKAKSKKADSEDETSDEE
ncbi:AP endonuclease [Lindgomyces ingoldianus]|uniref:AP endonuclease n=1 Tax=Lindgomyces ingoldianus TaxID=673940 RepID=A0ACB6RF22_9PLEO|nr:AP endonuclease [Lindgomyces ingoldianus]KAF2477731.1 AP endonuclease [Lindgomyces ingoldianus]